MPTCPYSRVHVEKLCGGKSTHLMPVSPPPRLAVTRAEATKADVPMRSVSLCVWNSTVAAKPDNTDNPQEKHYIYIFYFHPFRGSYPAELINSFFQGVRCVYVYEV